MKAPEDAPTCPVLALIVDGPLTAKAETDALRTLRPNVRSGLSGAAIRFEGIVRRDESDPDQAGAIRPLAALEYQTYDPMARRELEHLARRTAARHRLHAIMALHSRGRVPVGEVSLVLVVSGGHRAEAIAALTEFIDHLKQDVPIWKRPVWEQPTA